MKLFLAGDVMTGRGIDQILPHPGDPTIHEQWAKSATGYVDLAERLNGQIPSPVEPTYIWGDVLDVLESRDVALRVVNLETAVTDRGQPWPEKGIHYRMNPDNLDCMTGAGVDVCCLANNHVLDWSYEGLEQTLSSLPAFGLAACGAGRDREDAWRPATAHTNADLVVAVLSVSMTSSGVPGGWEAKANRPGVAMLPSDVDAAIAVVETAVRSLREPPYLFIVSVHWGPNWGYEIPRRHRQLARGLIDHAGVDVVHGHSSHHPMGIEVHEDKPILYGCGDLINDYEGIPGNEEFRPDLRVMYILTFDPESTHLEELELVPFVSRRFALEMASADDHRWLADRLTGVSRQLGTRFEVTGDRRLRACW